MHILKIAFSWDITVKHITNIVSFFLWIQHTSCLALATSLSSFQVWTISPDLFWIASVSKCFFWIISVPMSVTLMTLSSLLFRSCRKSSNFCCRTWKIWYIHCTGEHHNLKIAKTFLLKSIIPLNSLNAKTLQKCFFPQQSLTNDFPFSPADYLKSSNWFLFSYLDML